VLRVDIKRTAFTNSEMARILVIDDEEEVRLVLQKVLTDAGHDVVSASDGADGLKQFRAAPADLVITDLYMPDQEGIETMRQLRLEGPDVSIIVISGHPEAGAVMAVARWLGAAATLTKPFSPEELLSAISTAL
jgi:two-component system, chemotaxis family, chemotaxis protein CheY